MFAFEDDYSLGVLQSRVHTVWATERSTKLKTDPRYTVKSFASFPWPEPSADQRMTIAGVAAQVIERRRELCWGQGIGLTTLYNAISEGAYGELAALHAQLDGAVAQAYGWPASHAEDDEAIVRSLGELNRLVTSGEAEYNPFPTATGPTLFDE